MQRQGLRLRCPRPRPRLGRCAGEPRLFSDVDGERTRPVFGRQGRRNEWHADNDRQLRRRALSSGRSSYGNRNQLHALAVIAPCHIIVTEGAAGLQNSLLSCPLLEIV